MKVIRANAFVRAWPAEHGEHVGRAALVGIAEIDGTVDAECVHGMAILESDQGITLTATGQRLAPEYDIAGSEVDSILRSHSWPRPIHDTGLDGGGILLRRTRIPAETGTTCILVGLMSTDAMRDQTMIDIHGDMDGILHIGAPRCAEHLQTNGTTLSQILRRPLWGWGSEPWGLVSSMELSTIDDCVRLEAIRGGAPASEGEVERLERGHAGSVLGCARGDERYQRFRTLWLQRHGPQAWDGCQTKSQQEAAERLAEEIVREVMA